MTAFIQFARVRGLSALVGCAGVVAAAVAVLGESMAATLAGPDNRVMLAKTAVCLMGVAFTVGAVSPNRLLDEALPEGRKRACRACLYLTVAALAAVSCWPASWGLERDPAAWLALARNAVAALGLGASLVVALGRETAWAPLSLYAGACAFFGSLDWAGTPRWWALVNYPADSHGALAVSVALFAFGGALYTWLDAKA